MKPIFWVVVITFVAFIFFAWGMQSGTGGGAEVNAATVNGTPISRQDYRQALDRYLKRVRDDNNGSVPAEIEAKARREVLDQLIRRTIMLQEADRQGLIVTDKELAQSIVYSDRNFFNEQGQLDRGKLEMYQTRMPTRQWTSLEGNQREQILLNKLVDGITSSLRTSQSDMLGYYATYYRQFTLAQILIKPANLISEDRVKTYYAEHAAEFAQPLQVHARHILIAVRKDDPADSITRARNRAENIREMIIARKLDFASAARQYSNDIGSGAKGGDLGTFGKGAMVPEFELAAFALDSGVVSGVVQTEYGFHIIEVLQRLENEPFPLDKVREYIQRTLVGDSEIAVARRKAEQAIAELKAGRAFADVARQYSDAASGKKGGALGTLSRFLDPTLFNAEELEPLAQELINNSFIIAQVSEQLEAIPVGGYNSVPIRSPYGLHIVRVESTREADPAHFADFRGQVERELNNRLQEDIFSRWYEVRRAASEIKIFLEEYELNPPAGEAAPIAAPGPAPAPQF